MFWQNPETFTAETFKLKCEHEAQRSLLSLNYVNIFLKLTRRLSNVLADTQCLVFLSQLIVIYRLLSFHCLSVCTVRVFKFSAVNFYHCLSYLSLNFLDGKVCLPRTTDRQRNFSRFLVIIVFSGLRTHKKPNVVKINSENIKQNSSQNLPASGVLIFLTSW